MLRHHRGEGQALSISKAARAKDTINTDDQAERVADATEGTSEQGTVIRQWLQQLQDATAAQ